MRLHRRGGGGGRPNKTQRTHARTSCVSGSSASPQSSGASSSSSGPGGGEAVQRPPARSSVMGALAVVTVVAGCWLLAARSLSLSLSLSLSSLLYIPLRDLCELPWGVPKLCPKHELGWRKRSMWEGGGGWTRHRKRLRREPAKPIQKGAARRWGRERARQKRQLLLESTDTIASIIWILLAS